MKIDKTNINFYDKISKSIIILLFMVSLFKNTLLLIKSIKKTIKNSLFYCLFILFIIISFIFFIIAIFAISKNRTKILKYKPNYTYHYNCNTNNKDTNNIIMDNIDNNIDIVFPKNITKNYDKKNLLSHAECEELFLSHFIKKKINNNISNKTTNIKKNQSKSNIIKNISHTIEKKILKKKEIKKKKIVITKKKENIKTNDKIENKTIPIINSQNLSENNLKKDKNKLNNKIAPKISEISFSINSISKSNSTFSHFSRVNFHCAMMNYKDTILPETNTPYSIPENESLDNKEIVDNNIVEIIEDEEIINQNELKEYIMRLKKNIKQFPGKKVHLDITILLDKSSIKDIIFPKKLFSLAYKMYIINILNRIEIPKKLWNRKLLISL